MEKLKGKMAQEVSKIEERKAKIDDELKEVQVSGLVPVFVSIPISVSYEKTSPLFKACNPHCAYPSRTCASLAAFSPAAL